MTTTRAAVAGPVFVALWLCASVLSAQDVEPGATSGGETTADNAATENEAAETVPAGTVRAEDEIDPAAGSAPQDESTPQDPEPGAGYLRIDQDDVPLRCFATAHSPAYEERLGVGDVVRATGESTGDFVEVELPMGVVGWVHGHFVEPAEGRDGVVTSRARLSFRFSPEDRRAPIAVVLPGHDFLVLEREGDWLRVRNPEQGAWIPRSAAVSLGGAAAEAAWKDLEARQAEALEAVAEQMRAEREAQERLATLEKRSQQLRQQVAAEVDKAEQAADWGPIVASLENFRDEVLIAGEAASERFSAPTEALLERARHQQKILELLATSREEPKPPTIEVDLEPAPRRSPIASFDASGWLRYERSALFGEVTVTVEKGGQGLFRLVCSSGRYDLSMYEDLEIAVRGEATRPDPEDLRVLDVRSLEVIGRRIER